MKKNPILFVLSLSLLFFAPLRAQNTLSVANIEASAGKTIMVPVGMSNADEIVAAQFDIALPYALDGDMVLTNRGNGHTVSCRSLGNNAYTVIVVSMEGKTLRGNDGTLVTIPIKVDPAAVEGDYAYITLTNAVLAKRDGSNACTGTARGLITVSHAAAPDLTPSAVAIEESTIKPGDIIHVGWQVNNIGDVATGGGWSENIYLVNVNTEEEVFLGTVYAQSTLAAGGVESRSAEMLVPEVPATDGTVKVKVSVVPSSETGEVIAYQGNNTAISSGQTGSTATLKKVLTLTAGSTSIKEGSTTRLRLTLTRSGDRSAAATFPITNPQNGLLSLPASVTIPAGQSAITFYATSVDNVVANEQAYETIQIPAANGYNGVQIDVEVVDDEQLDMSLSFSDDDITEGESTTLTITRPRTTKEVVFALSSNLPKRFQHAASVVMPVGVASAEVEITATDDDAPDVEQTATFTVRAEGYNNAQKALILQDNDMPDIDLQLTPTSVGEGAGPTAIMAKITRQTITGTRITVKLTDNSDGDIYYPRQSIVLDKGVTTAEFTLGVIDNSQVDGDRTVAITAAVYVSSCDCSTSGENHGSVTRDLEIIDDDGAALTLTTVSSVIQEGAASGTTLTVTRNTATTEPLTVTLSAADDYVQLPSTITIAAGSKNATVTVKALANDVTGDSRAVSFTASADGYSRGTCWLMISDETLPDASLPSLTLSSPQSYAEGTVDATVEIANDGVIALPPSTRVIFYCGSTPVDTVNIRQTLSPGSRMSMTRTLPLPKRTGATTIWAEINGDHKVNECLYANNASEKVAFTLRAPYASTVSVTDNIFERGASVILTGTATKVTDGAPAAGVPVEVYILNNGARDTLLVTTNGDGTWRGIYTTNESQMGHFSVGACYPDEKLTTEMAAFNIYGLRRVNTGYITCDITCGTPYTGAVVLENPGVLDLTEVEVEVTNRPTNCAITFGELTSIEAGARASLTYSIDGLDASPGTDWEKLNVRVTSAEGATLSFTIHYYCRLPKGQLYSVTTAINTTMIKGQSRDYSFAVVNHGKGDTGTMTLALPQNAPWMTSVTPLQMASLAPDESAEIILRFTPTDDMQLNVPYTGTIGVNIANGKGIPISFRIEPVSETTGTLVVDVCDEFTYYTEEAPHVSGAEVVIRHPSTNRLIAQGRTTDDGHFEVELPEGYYKVDVAADNHESFSGTLRVDPGTTTFKTINLSFEAIKVSWNVVETEVEDVYDIVTTVKYATNVPVPVIKTVFPDTIPLAEIEDKGFYMFTAYMTNTGLIAAKQTSLVCQPIEGLKYEYYYENGFDLPASSSVALPIKVSLDKEYFANAHRDGLRRKGFITCSLDAIADWFWDCGETPMKNNEALRAALQECAAGVGGNGSYGGVVVNGSLGKPSGDGYGLGFGGASDKGKVEDYVYDCDQCTNNRRRVIWDCIKERIPYVKTIYKIIEYVECVESIVVDGDIQCVVEEVVTRKIPEEITDFIDVMQCIKKFINACDDLPGHGGEMSTPAHREGRHNASERAVYVPIDGPSYISTYARKSFGYINGAAAYWDLSVEIFGDEAWLSVSDEEYNVFLQGFQKWYQKTIDDETLATVYKPSTISDEQMSAFIERMHNTFDGQSSATTANTISVEAVKGYAQEIKDAKDEALKNGASDMLSYIDETEEEFELADRKESGSVCATISLQISQTLVMTRQAFLGTLTVFNGHETEPMTDVRLTLSVTDENGDEATSHEFQMDCIGLDGFQGELTLPGGWSLGAQETGVASIQFIPTRYAAPDKPVEYSFGGTLTYTNPFNGTTMTRQLYPVKLTVKPSPVLDLTYFMQRDIMGDNPLTKDVVEPMEPSEFALLINNVGNGDATQVRLTTNQPEIVENEKGLLIDFEILSSTVNGKDKTMALGGSVASDFGTINAHHQSYAQWELQSTLLGHFVDYQVSATHVTSYGNEDLSLLGDVTIHELIHSIRVPNEGRDDIVGWLVNDIDDSFDTPDMLYFSDAAIEEVSVVSESLVTVQTLSEGTSSTLPDTYLVTVLPERDGWCYGSIADPIRGQGELISVTRQSDGQAVSLHNFWQTEYTLKDGRDPLHEYRLHFVDSLTLAGDSYVLKFQPAPINRLSVSSFSGYDATSEILTKPVTSLDVTFNKQVVPDTFTPDDITLICQGNDVNLERCVITTADSLTFHITLPATATVADGYYVLTVQTAAITDTEGFLGADGRTAVWVQYTDSKTVAGIVTDDEHQDGVFLEKGETTRVTFTTQPADAVFDVANLSWDITSTSTTQADGTPRGWTLLSVTPVRTDGGFALDMEGFVSGTYVLTFYYSGISEPIGSLNVQVASSLDLVTGWNWLSTADSKELPEVSRFSLVFGSQLLEVRSQNAVAACDPVYGFFGTLSALQPNSCYKFKTTSEQHWAQYGIRSSILSQSLLTPVPNGWTWLANPYDRDYTLSDVSASWMTTLASGSRLVSHNGTFAVVTTLSGSAQFFGTLETLTAGDGYMLYNAGSDATLTWQPMSRLGQEPAASAITPFRNSDSQLRSSASPFDYDPHRFADVMSIIATVDGIDEPAGITVGAFVGDECRGSGSSKMGYFFIGVSGENGEAVSFRAYDEQGDCWYDILEAVTFTSQLGTIEAPLQLHAVPTAVTPAVHVVTPDTYDLAGRKMPAGALLQPGIYIQHGKRIVVGD